MTAIIDIIIAAILAITVILAIQRGFVKTMLGTLGFAIALLVAVLFHSPVADSLAEGAFGESAKNLVHSAIDNTITEENYEAVFSDKEDSDTESALERVFSLFDAEDKYESISESYDEWRQNGLATVKEKLKDNLTEPGVDLCCTVLAYLIIFVIARIALKIAEVVLDKVVALPVLKQANKVLGAVAGAVLAIFRVFIFCFALKLILPIANGLGIEWLSAIKPESSVLYHLFDSGNFLANIL